jgi:hypothetical protein
VRGDEIVRVAGGLRRLESVGHMVPIEAPGAIAEAVAQTPRA